MSWHNLSGAEWIKIWDEQHWRPVVLVTLVEIAVCDEADASDRFEALQLINSGMVIGLFEPDLTYPALACQVMLEVTMDVRGRWWKRWYKRREMKRKLVGATATLSSAAAIAKLPAPDDSVIDVRATPAIDKLLS
jgi:hypothetical protein